MAKGRILTEKELEVIRKRLSHKKLNQQDSNRLSRQVRPKLREMVSINPEKLLNKLDYKPKIKAIEKKTVETIKEKILELDAVILYGSAVQTNYNEYNDIDILIITKKEVYKRLADKIKKAKEIEIALGGKKINADIQIYDKKTLKESYPRNPGLIYQLKDHKVIYGKLVLKKNIKMFNIDLHMKLDWSNIEQNSEGREIYKAIRNVILVRLLLSRIIDNEKLKESLNNELGRNLIERLKNNKESKLDRKIALHYLDYILKLTRKEIKGGLWEKLEL